MRPIIIAIILLVASSAQAGIFGRKSSGCSGGHCGVSAPAAWSGDEVAAPAGFVDVPGPDGTWARVPKTDPMFNRPKVIRIAPGSQPGGSPPIVNPVRRGRLFGRR